MKLTNPGFARVLHKRSDYHEPFYRVLKEKDHGGYGYTQVPVPKTERWIVHKENEDSKNKK